MRQFDRERPQVHPGNAGGQRPQEPGSLPLRDRPHVPRNCERAERIQSRLVGCVNQSSRESSITVFYFFAEGLLNLLVAYFERFGEKPCCFSDLKVFLPNLTDDKLRVAFREKVLAKVDLSPKGVPVSVNAESHKTFEASFNSTFFSCSVPIYTATRASSNSANSSASTKRCPKPKESS